MEQVVFVGCLLKKETSLFWKYGNIECNTPQHCVCFRVYSIKKQLPAILIENVMVFLIYHQSAIEEDKLFFYCSLKYRSVFQYANISRQITSAHTYIHTVVVMASSAVSCNVSHPSTTTIRSETSPAGRQDI